MALPEPLAAKPLPTFTLHGVTSFNVNNVESPFIAHWLEIEADKRSSFPHVNVHDWTAVVRLLEAAICVASIWSAGTDEQRNRLTRKLAFAREQRAKAA